MTFHIILHNPVFYKPAYSKYSNNNDYMFNVICDNCHLQNLDISMSSPDDPDNDLCLECFNILKKSNILTDTNIFLDDEFGAISPKNIMTHRFHVIDWLDNNNGWNDDGIMNYDKMTEYEILYQPNK